MRSPTMTAFVMAWLTIAAVPALAQRFYAANRANTLELLALPDDAKASVMGTAKGRELKSYTFWAEVGQHVDISLRTSSPSLYFNLEPPSGNDAIFRGDMMGSGQRFIGALGETGMYRITISFARTLRVTRPRASHSTSCARTHVAAHLVRRRRCRS